MCRLFFPEGSRCYLLRCYLPPGGPRGRSGDATGRQPRDRGDAAPRESVALAHVLNLLGPLPANPLAPAEVLACGLYQLQPRQRPFPGHVPLHLCEYDGQVQCGPPRYAVPIDGFPEADDLDYVLPQPSQSSKISVRDPPKRSSAAAFTQSSGWRAAFRKLSPGRVQEAPPPHPRRPVRSRRWFSRLLASASLATDTRAYPNGFPLISRWPPVLAW